MASRSGSLESLREVNRLRVVDSLRQHGSLSRAEIARRTGLSRSTVSTLVADLVARGVVTEREIGSAGQQGRPPVLLALDPSAGAAVGVDFDHDHVHVAVSDLSRTVLAERFVPEDVDHEARRALDTAATLIEQLLVEANVERERVVGVGMALAGPVDHERGKLHASAILPSWEKLDAAAELGKRLGLPVHLDNDANCGALAEVTLGAGRNVRDAVYLEVSAGIGAGIIVNGNPYRGSAGTAGEIGHLVIDEQGPVCRCGNRGCLETLASAPAMLELLKTRRGELTIQEMIEQARTGDAACRRVIQDAGTAIGRAVAVLCNLLNPEMVVVGGELDGAGELLLAPLRESVKRHAIPAATEGLEIVAGALGHRANVLGALALAIAQSEHVLAARVTGLAS